MAKTKLKTSVKGGHRRKVYCNDETFNRIMTDCVDEYLEHHPEFKTMKITQPFIMEKISKFYMEQ